MYIFTSTLLFIVLRDCISYHVTHYLLDMCKCVFHVCFEINYFNLNMMYDGYACLYSAQSVPEEALPKRRYMYWGRQRLPMRMPVGIYWSLLRRQICYVLIISEGQCK